MSTSPPRTHAWLVPSLDGLLEGAWIGVVDALFAASAGTRPLGPLPFALLALASLVWVRSSPDRRTTYLGLGALYLAAFFGAGLLGGGPPGETGLAANFSQASAVLGCVAVFRGSRHVDAPDDDLVVGNVLQFGFPLLALPWLFATVQASTVRDAFVGAAFPSTLLFGTAGLFALGLSRLDALTAASGLDWRRNRPWLVLLVGVLATMTVIAVPAAFLLGTPITSVLAGLAGPLAIVLSPVAEVLRRILEVFLGFLQPIFEWLQSLMSAHPIEPVPDQGGGFGSLPPLPPDGTGEASTTGVIFLALAVLAIAIVVLVVVVRLTFARPAVLRAVPDQPLEEREYRLPALSLHLPRFSRRGRRPEPRTASEAYVAFLGMLEARPDLAREPAEPPATHAARIRGAGVTDPRAALLAADYQLEHYALRRLSPRETARALLRERRLRGLLRR